VDPVAAKRYKFAARCELNLVGERNRKPDKCGMHTCAKRDFSAAKRRVSEIQLHGVVVDDSDGSSQEMHDKGYILSICFTD